MQNKHHTGTHTRMVSIKHYSRVQNDPRLDLTPVRIDQELVSNHALYFGLLDEAWVRR